MPRLCILWAAAALTACASQSGVSPVPRVNVPDGFVTEYRPPAGENPLWWQGFGDAALNRLVDRAFDRNFSVEIARERLASARALLVAERADRFPTIDGAADAELIGDSDDLRAGVGAGASILFDANLSGRLSREIEAALANARAAEYLVADARRVVAAAVAEQYIALRRSEVRLGLLEESTDLQRQTLRIVELRFGAGLSANLDVRRAAADLANTEAQRGLLELQRAEAARALSLLSGDPPEALPPIAEEPAIPGYRGGPPTGTPVDLLRRRPDLIVAEARLVEAGARVGVERADLYPSLVIPAEITIGDVAAGGLLGNVFATVAAALDIPIFDAGRRRAEVAAAEAEARARFIEYRQVTYAALGEVENALVAIQSYDERSQALRQAIEQSESAFNQSNALYREGLTSLFDVLDAQRQLIGSREDLIDSEANLASSIIALYAAIGSPTADRLSASP